MHESMHTSQSLKIQIPIQKIQNPNSNSNFSSPPKTLKKILRKEHKKFESGMWRSTFIRFSKKESNRDSRIVRRVFWPTFDGQFATSALIKNLRHINYGSSGKENGQKGRSFSTFDDDCYNEGMNHHNENLGQNRRAPFSPVKHDFLKHVAFRDGSMELKDACARRAIQMAETLYPSVVCVLINACKRGKYVNTELLQALASRLLSSDDVINDMNEVHVSMVIQSLGALWRDAEFKPTFFPNFVPLVNALLVVSLSRERYVTYAFNEQSIANVMHGLGLISKGGGAIDTKTQRELVDVLLGKITHQRRINKCTPQGLSNIIYGCAQMEHANQHALDVLGKRCKQLAQKLGAQSLSLIVYGFGLLGYVNEGVMRTLCVEIQKPERLKEFWEQHISNLLYGFCKMRYKNNDVLDALSREICNPARVANFREQGLANIVYGFGQLRYTNQEVLGSLCEEIRKPLRISKFNEQELSMILYAFGLMKHWDEATLDAMSQELRRASRLTNLSNQNLSNIIYAFALLKYIDHGALNGLASEILRGGRLERFSNQGLSNIVYGFGILGYKNEVVMKALSKEIQSPARLSLFTGQALSNILYGMAVMGFNDLAILDALSSEVQNPLRLETFNEQELGSVVHSCAKLGYVNTDLLTTLSEEICKASRLANIKEQGLANIVYAYGKLDYDNLAHLDSLGKEIARPSRLVAFNEQELANIMYGFGKLHYGNKHVFDGVREELCKPSRMVELKEQGIVNIINVFAKLGYQDDATLHALAQEIAQESRLSCLTNRQIANLILAFGKLQYGNDDVLRTMIREAGVEERVVEYNSHDLSDIVHGLGLVKGQLSYDFKVQGVCPLIQSLLVEVGKEEKLIEFTIHDASNLLWGVGELQYYNPPLLDLLVDRQLDMRDLLEPIDIFMLMHSCAVLNHRHEALIDYFIEWIEDNLPDIQDVQRITGALWSLSVFNRLTPDLFTRLCLELVPAREWLDLRAHTKLHQAWLYLMPLLRDAPLPPDITELVQQAQHECKEGFVNVTSAFEVDVRNTLAELGVPFEGNVAIANGCMVVDIMLLDKPNVVIDVDGPHHYTINEWEGQLWNTGGTILRNKVVENCGFKILCVPYFEWRGLDQEGKRNYLQKLLADC